MFRNLIAIGMSIGVLAFADTVTLRDGTIVEGSYVGGDSRHVRILVGSDVQTLDVSKIHSVVFAEAPATQGATAAPSSGDAPPRMRRRHVDEATQASNDAPAPAPAPAAPAAASGGGFVPATGAEAVASSAAPAAATTPPDTNGQAAPSIPTGADLVIRLTDPVDSEKDAVGKTYRATLDQDVVVNNQTVIPRGANVTAKLLSDQKSGKITGQTILTLALTQIEVNGKTYDIDTTAVNQSSKGRGKQSAERIGGLGALGALIGGLAGGGAGAAIGAAAGAATGTGVQVMTKGQKVKVPAETKLTFSLQEPLQL